MTKICPPTTGIVLIAALVLAIPAAGAVEWRGDAERALRDAKRNGRYALLNIGADWCAACEKLEKTTLADPAVVRTLDPLVRIKIDGDRTPELARRFRATDYPTLILLDPRGREVARRSGSVGADELLGLLRGAGAGCDLQGRLTDAAGEPQPEKTLLLIPGQREAVSREDGFYCFGAVAPGAHELLVLDEVGVISRHELSIVEGQPMVLDLAARPDGRSESLVVTATRTAKLLRDVQVRTEVISRERIDQSAARTLADAVEYTPGVRVESNCQNCNFSQVRMLGLEGAYSQILIDGLAQWSPLSMVYGIEQIPTRLIDRLEVVKGGGSTVYGPGAVGGVINVIPRRPKGSGGDLELRAESIDGEASRSLSGAYDWVSADRSAFVTFYGQDDELPGLDLSGDGFTEISRRELTTAGLRGEKAWFDGRGRLTVDVGYSDAHRRGGDQIDLPPEQTELAEQIDTRRVSSTLRFAHALSNERSYHLAASYVTTARDTYYGGGQDPNAFGFSDNPLLLVEAQSNHGVGEHTLSWGAQFQSDGIVDSQPAIGRQLDLAYSDLGLFLQDDWTTGANSSLLFGLRADKHSEIDRVIFSPRAAFRWSPTKELTVRSSLSTGFRPPAVFDEDLHIELAGGSQRQVVLAADLEEERSLSLMQGFEWIPKRGEAFWLVEANLFYTAIDGVFEEEQIGENLFEKRNLSDAEVYGIELGLGYDLPRLFTVELGWVAQRSRFDRPEADFGSRDVFRTPESSGVINLTVRAGRWGDGFVTARYTGPMDVPRYVFDDTGNQIDARLIDGESFVTIDASWARRFALRQGKARLRLQLGVRNLTDAFQSEIDQGAFRDSNFVYGPRFPRSVYVATSLGF